ncbi:hypothetical protein RJT34_04930 [Clitoria ternatea]|uniref:Uncharacterized protein n=1 Tax=Clitoria ternatea TaxID=43366 RepID=A0AAN9Q3V2_CLITE
MYTIHILWDDMDERSQIYPLVSQLITIEISIISHQSISVNIHRSTTQKPAPTYTSEAISCAISALQTAYWLLNPT